MSAPAYMEHRRFTVGDSNAQTFIINNVSTTEENISCAYLMGNNITRTAEDEIKRVVSGFWGTGAGGILGAQVNRYSFDKGDGVGGLDYKTHPWLAITDGEATLNVIDGAYFEAGKTYDIFLFKKVGE